MRKLRTFILTLLSMAVLVSPTVVMPASASASHSGTGGSVSNATVICIWSDAKAHRFFTAWDTYIVNEGCYIKTAPQNISTTWRLVVAVTGHDWTGAEIYRSFPDTFGGNSVGVSQMSGDVPNLAKVKLWAAMCPKPPYQGPCLFPALAAEA